MLDLRLGDCRDLLPTVAAQSVDAVITDPPYPEISRAYGRITEAEWWDMMMMVCTEVRRILKPTGSAVFILQPNSRKVGSMRGWLWRFMYWVTTDWNMVQDAWWWNYGALPVSGAITHGLMRASIKPVIWAGPADCFRDQKQILWAESERMIGERMSARFLRGDILVSASGRSVHKTKISSAPLRNGGATPYNLMPVCNNDPAHDGAGANGHGAGTPLALADWWTRYIVPPAGVVCDPFMGSGTMGIAAVRRGHSFIGFEKMDAPGYFPTARERITEAQEQMRLAIC